MSGPPSLPPSPVSPGEARDLVDGVLARPELDGLEPTLLERIQDWFLDRLSDLVGLLVGSGGTTAAGWVVLVVVVAGALVLVVRSARGLGRRRGGPVGEAPPALEPADEADWLSAAAEHEARGDWGGGLRCRYRAMVEGLAERGVVAAVPGRTPRENRDEVDGARPDLAPAVDLVAAAFERAWYAGIPPDRDDCRRVAEAAAAVAAAADPAGARA